MNRAAFERAVAEVQVYSGLTRAEVLALPLTVFALTHAAIRARRSAS